MLMLRIALLCAVICALGAETTPPASPEAIAERLCQAVNNPDPFAICALLDQEAFIDRVQAHGLQEAISAGPIHHYRRSARLSFQTYFVTLASQQQWIRIAVGPIRLGESAPRTAT